MSGNASQDAYAAAGVDQAAADDAVAALVRSLSQIDTGKPLSLIHI